jgi:hypothetical protein
MSSPTTYHHSVIQLEKYSTQVLLLYLINPYDIGHGHLLHWVTSIVGQSVIVGSSITHSFMHMLQVISFVRYIV